MNALLKICFLWQTLFINLNADTIVTIPDGKIRGRQEYSLRNISFYAFQQIPYAKPPVGDLRFKDSQPAEKWDGILEAVENTKFCFQQSDLYGITNLSVFENEDCLYLNVYTPTKPSIETKLPVMFFIYGGGFVSGAANFDFFGPHYFMENDVILVTINYRVGPFGFLTTGDSVIPGNFGLKDQLLGLQWVQKNIAYFGGDPKKVTIFGQSAGGASVAFHLISKKSEGLFRAAISQSGSVLCPWAYQRNYKKVAYTLAKYINSNFSTGESSEKLLSFLQNVPATQLNEAAKSFPSDIIENQITDGFLFTPVVEPEGENAFITEMMYSALENGHVSRVPLMIGVCSEESVATVNDMNNFIWRVQQFDQDTTKLVNSNMHISNEEEKIKTGNAIRNIYTNGGLLINYLGNVVRYYSDTSFNRAVIQHARLQSRFSDVYFYQFSYYGEIIGNRSNISGQGRTGHSDDNYFLWTRFNESTLDKHSQSDVLTSERYRTLFTNFAKFMNPTPEKTNLLNITWHTVKPDYFRYLDINETLSIKTNPKGDVFPSWLKVYNKYARRPYDTF